MLEKTFKIPLTTERSNHKINSEYPLEGLMLKQKLQYFGHLMWRADSLKKPLILGKIEGMKRRGQRRMRWLDYIIDPMDMNFSKLQERLKDSRAWRAAVHGLQTVGHDWAIEQHMYISKLLNYGSIISNVLTLKEKNYFHLSHSSWNFAFWNDQD